MSAWGMVVCTGSNLLVRSPVVQAVGGFPGKTITEDYMLGLELAKAGFKSRYLQKYMALGTVAHQAAAVPQTCSMWNVCKDACRVHLLSLPCRGHLVSRLQPAAAPPSS